MSQQKAKGTKSRIEEILAGLDELTDVFGPYTGTAEHRALTAIAIHAAEVMACKWLVSGYYRVPAGMESDGSRQIRKKANDLRREYGIPEIPFPDEPN